MKSSKQEELYKTISIKWHILANNLYISNNITKVRKQAKQMFLIKFYFKKTSYNYQLAEFFLQCGFWFSRLFFCISL